MAAHRFRIEPYPPRILLDQPRDRTVRHGLAGQPPLRVDPIEQRPRAAPPHRQPGLEPLDGPQRLTGGNRDHLPLPLLVGLGMAQRQLQALVHQLNIAPLERDQF